VSGVIRGDEPSWRCDAIVDSETFAGRRCNVLAVHVYPESSLIRRVALAPQPLHDRARRRPDEPLVPSSEGPLGSHAYPTDMAPLTDIECSHPEVVNPFMTDRLMKVARELPDALREEPKGFEAVSSRLTPHIPEAKRSDIAGSARLLSSWAELNDEIVADLSSSDAERICDRSGRDRVLAALKATRNSSFPAAAHNRRACGRAAPAAHLPPSGPTTRSADVHACAAAAAREPDDRDAVDRRRRARPSGPASFQRAAGTTAAGGRCGATVGSNDTRPGDVRRPEMARTSGDLVVRLAVPEFSPRGPRPGVA
jgi:hypothetical protein